MLQESLIALWKNAASFGTKRGSVLTYFYFIARNKAIDLMRKKKRILKLIHKIVQWRAYRGLEPAHVGDETDNEKIIALARIIHRLPPMDQVILLASTNGRGWAKILSLQLGIDPSTIRSRRLWLVRMIRKTMNTSF